jgi:peptidoglycan/xylan/chitin deacetylase (PgdA/CDA1 family)
MIGPRGKLALGLGLGIVLVLVFALTAFSKIRSDTDLSPVTSPPAANAVRPLNNNCSGGYVTFTFDDGPKVLPQGDTPLVISTLVKLHLTAVFFVQGTTDPPQTPSKRNFLIREEVRDGFSVQNHTWDHADWTGQTMHTTPLTLAQVKSELERGAKFIISEGAPAPYLYRPPFDDVTPAKNAVAASLGERLVMSYGEPGHGIIDSQDWRRMLTGDQIAYNVIHGYKDEAGNWVPGLQNGSVIGYHDSMSGTVVPSAAESLQPIVDYMNAHHLCSTNTVRPDATGGVVPNIPVAKIPFGRGKS